jgi:hypothetical protein
MALDLLAQKGQTLRFGANFPPVHLPGGRLPIGLAAGLASTTINISPNFYSKFTRSLTERQIPDFRFLAFDFFLFFSTRSRPVQESYAVRDDLGTKVLLPIGPIPAMIAQSAFNVNQLTLRKKLVALFGQFIPGNYLEPVGFLFLFA